MAAQLDHTIVPAYDKEKSAAFFAEILGLPEPTTMGPFAAVEIAHGTTFDFADAGGEIRPLHYAFRVDSDEEFDTIFARIVERDLPYWADPFRIRPQEIAQRGRGRAFYFEDPNGHFFEVLTRPDLPVLASSRRSMPDEMTPKDREPSSAE
jgi:catechol 2,3-dioxygenase-like lactoylglutathione lyase family enzyme